MKIVALSGGVGGARMAHGLAQCLQPCDLTVIVNIGDDFNHLGLRICPDLDTVCYTLAGLANETTGWGRSHETWTVLQEIDVLGGPNWFRMGDRDLGTHLERTRRLALGNTLSEITRQFCQRWGVEVSILPVSDDRVGTIVDTAELGKISFQEYFVKNQCRPIIKGFHFEGAQTARPAKGVLSSIEAADFIVFTPSNPWVSIDPILAVQGVIPALKRKKIVAISPIIAGKAIKGPLVKMYQEMNIEPGALAIANHYRGLISALFIDTRDAHEALRIAAMDIFPQVTDILMPTPESRKRLGGEIIAFLKHMVGESGL